MDENKGRFEEIFAVVTTAYKSTSPMDFVAVLLFIELIIYISNLEFFIIELIRYFSISEILHNLLSLQIAVLSS